MLRTKEHEQVREYDLEESVERQKALEEKERVKKKEEKGLKKQAKKDADDKVRMEGMDDGAMAALGFGAFGSSKK
jgi:hypothetical protein